MKNETFLKKKFLYNNKKCLFRDSQNRLFWIKFQNRFNCLIYVNNKKGIMKSVTDASTQYVFSSKFFPGAVHVAVHELLVLN